MGYSLGLPSNIGMSEGFLFGILGQLVSWKIRSLINLVKSWRFNPSIKVTKGWLALAPILLPSLVPAMVELGLEEDEGT